MAAERSLLLLAALVSACAALNARAPPAQEGLRLGGGHHATNASKATKTMAVRGHAVSEVSASWTGNVVYAIFTSAIPGYHDALLAQLDTWAARPAAQGRYVAVGGNNYPAAWQEAGVPGNILRSECRDDLSSISCKEAALLAEGAARGADWLYVIGEDNYVHTGNVEAFLSSKDPDEAVAYGTVGCGKGLFCRDSELFNTLGGFCGGSGYIISRAALQLLLVGGAPRLHAIYDNTRWPNDMTTSCQLRKHEVRLAVVSTMFGFPMIGITDYEAVARGFFLTVHYVRPAAMRWFHAFVQGAADSVKRPLEEAAFDHGCARGMGGAWLGLAREYASCLASEGGRKAGTWNNRRVSIARP